MSDHIQAIYENGVLRPLSPLDLAENSIVEVDVRDVTENSDDKEQKKELWLRAFDDWMNNLDPDTPNLTDEQISRESMYSEQLDRQR